MKTYRVYLKSGASFIIKGTKFENDGSGRIHLYNDDWGVERHIYLNSSEVAAIIAVEFLISEEK